ncbi:hypothetical protein D9M71_807990 [compost metagenome]
MGARRYENLLATSTPPSQRLIPNPASKRHGLLSSLNKYSGNSLSAPVTSMRWRPIISAANRPMARKKGFAALLMADRMIATQRPMLIAMVISSRNCMIRFYGRQGE